MSSVTDINQARPSEPAHHAESPTGTAAKSLEVLRRCIEELTHTACEALDLGNPARDELQAHAYEAVHLVRRAEKAIHLAGAEREQKPHRGALAEDQAAAVRMALMNATGLVEGANEYLKKLVLAYVHLSGACQCGADTSERLSTFAEDAAEVAGHLDCMEGHFAEVREAVGLSAEVDATDQAAEE